MKKPNTNILLRLLDSLIKKYTPEESLKIEIENSILDIVECIEFIERKNIIDIIDSSDQYKVEIIKQIKEKKFAINLIFEKTFFPGEIIPIYTPEKKLKDKIEELKIDLTVLTREYIILNENSIENKEDKAIQIIDTVNSLEYYENTNIAYITGIKGEDWKTIKEVIEMHKETYFGERSLVKEKK